VVGQVNGEPYDVTYTPSKDIGDVYTVDVSYGFAAGLSPNAAVVMLLQLRGDGLIDRSTVRRNMPFAIDDEAMQRSMDVEQTADAMKQGLGGLLASLGPMAAQGLDPRPYLRAAAEVVQGRRNGKDLADLMIAAFAPEVMDPEKAKAQAAAAADPSADPAAAGGPGLPGQDPNTGLPTGTVPGQAGMPPGGAPDLQTLIAGMRNGKPQLDAAVLSRRLPTPHEHARRPVPGRCPSGPTPRRSPRPPASRTGRPVRCARRSRRRRCLPRPRPTSSTSAPPASGRGSR
jgi:hypothetical protein